MSKKYLSTIDISKKYFEDNGKPISKKTKAKMKKASQLAQVKIDHNNEIYRSSASNAHSYYVI